MAVFELFEGHGSRPSRRVVGCRQEGWCASLSFTRQFGPGKAKTLKEKMPDTSMSWIIAMSHSTENV
eukprot:730421-Rhodomonas_salina.2